MNVEVNGEARELPTHATVADAVALLSGARASSRGLAVALDGEVVRRGDWSTVALGEGSRIEVLSAIGGG